MNAGEGGCGCRSECEQVPGLPRMMFTTLLPSLRNLPVPQQSNPKFPSVLCGSTLHGEPLSHPAPLDQGWAGDTPVTPWNPQQRPECAKSLGGVLGPAGGNPRAQQPRIHAY